MIRREFFFSAAAFGVIGGVGVAAWELVWTSARGWTRQLTTHASSGGRQAHNGHDREIF